MAEGARGTIERVPQVLQGFDAALASKVGGYIATSDNDEESRRRTDRIGGNLYYGRHWNVTMPKNRAAITANVTKALIDHKIAIMTKQNPMPVVETDDSGSKEGARLMRPVLQNYWIDDGMMLKSRQALRLANTTRTAAGKTMWDPTLRGGAGDITTDIIPGWRMIVDPRTRDRDRMEYAGDRARMSRTRAMLLYPEAADVIKEGGETTNKLFGSSSQSPLQSQWVTSGVDFAASSGGTIVNGKPIITAFTGRGPSKGAGEYEVEIIELYWRDRTLVDKEVELKDSVGNPVMEVERDEDGMPLFERTDEIDDVLGEPGFKLRMKPKMVESLVPKYPFYRRTTMIAPDMNVLEDTAWDGPLPYSFLNDNEPLEGIWAKGCALDLEDLQAQLNVSLSTMTDNLRFSSYRAFLATQNAALERNNLVISPGDIIRVGQSTDNLKPLQFPELSPAWFQWVDSIIKLMERIIGATGIMQGEAAGRMDSAAGTDSLAEIGGSRLVECTQRFELFLADVMKNVGFLAQRYYTEKHAVKVENAEGQLTWERAAREQLQGSFRYKIAFGSTLAWNSSGIRKQVLEDFQLGLRDKISVWQKLDVEDWQLIKSRIEASQGPGALGLAPPPRTRQSVPKAPNQPKGSFTPRPRQ